MIKKVGKNFFKAAAALIVSAGLFSACGNIADVTIDGSTDAGARSAGAGITLRAKAKTASTDRFQFRISGVSITGTETITFDIRPSSYSKASTITVRDGSNSNTKWLADADIYSLSSSTDSAGETWYRVSAKAKNSTSTLGFTIGGAAEAGAKVYIKNLKIGSSYVDIKTSNCKTWSQPSEVEFSVSQSDDNGGTNPVQPSDGNLKYVGFRYSDYGVHGKEKVTNNYPLPEPTPSDWNNNYVSKFVKKIPGTTGMFVFIVGSIHDSDDGEDDCLCGFRFKSPDSTKNSTYLKFEGSKKIKLSDGEEYTAEQICENFLKMCDTNGYKVWLQVEPGKNDLAKLADIVMKKFNNHKCVQGFGVDLEWWYRYTKVARMSDGKVKTDDHHGKPINAEETDKVIEAVRKYGENYTVFIKHYNTAWLPQKAGTTSIKSGVYHQEYGEPSLSGMKYANKLILVNDSQDFEGSESSMKSDFMKWIELFPNTDIVYQIGYYADKKIWNDKNKPMDLVKKIGEWSKEKKSKVGGTGSISVIWVDFSMSEILSALK